MQGLYLEGALGVHTPLTNRKTLLTKFMGRDSNYESSKDDTWICVNKSSFVD